MPVEPTHSESCIRDSIKKYFIDKLTTIEEKHVEFDKRYQIPTVNGVEIKEWYMIRTGRINIDNLSRAELLIYCYTREDLECSKLSTIRDILFSYLEDLDATDGFARIPLYNTLSEPWVQIGALIPFVRLEAEHEVGEDGTNFKWIRVDLRWGAK